jgi:hypothetical protein
VIERGKSKEEKKKGERQEKQRNGMRKVDRILPSHLLHADFLLGRF